MPRLARVIFPGQLYHVTQRGNYRQNVFFDDQDRVVYLKYLEEYALKYELKIYAFCLMGNHVHFVVSPCHDRSMAFAFRVTHQKYSLYLNKRLKQLGHLWQSRFYSCLLIGDHIQKALRYVERNPVRAGMVNNPCQYTWSSARIHAGIRCKTIITLTGINDYVEKTSWKDYIARLEKEEDLDNIRIGTAQGKAFGPMEKIEVIEKETGYNLQIKNRGRPFKVN